MKDTMPHRVGHMLSSRATGDARARILADTERLLYGGVHSARDLVRLLERADAVAEVRALACWALGSLRPRGYLRALIRVLGADPNETVAFHAAKAIVDANPRGAGSQLKQVLRMGRAPVNRRAAAWAIGQLRSKSALPELLELLTNVAEAPDVRGEVAEAIGELDDRRAVMHLVGCLRERSAKVRFWATHALRRLGDPGAIPALQRLLKDKRRAFGARTVSAEAGDAIKWLRRCHGSKRNPSTRPLRTTGSDRTA